jgi:hypothetical protein
MWIAIVIVSGCFAISVVASIFDFLGKKKGRDDKALDKKIGLLEGKIDELERRSLEKEERIAKLETDVAFMNRLIEDKTAK